MAFDFNSNQSRDLPIIATEIDSYRISVALFYINYKLLNRSMIFV